MPIIFGVMKDIFRLNRIILMLSTYYINDRNNNNMYV